MRRPALLLAAAAIAAGCGGSLTQSSERSRADALSAYGMSVVLPAGWNGRIVLGASGRPVLHAAAFPLSANDDDNGEIAREGIGTGRMYINVRNLGRGASTAAFPLTLTPTDFERSPPEQGRHTQASREIAVAGELYSITAVAGGDESPAESMVEDANRVLNALRLDPYVPDVVPRLPADAMQIEGYGISMRLPRGWTGQVGRGELDAFSGDIHLRLLEHASNDGFVTGRIPIELTPAEFVQPGGGSDPRIPASTGRSFVASGRQFVLWVDAGSFPPSAEVVEQANEALATLSVEPGDFYRGTVEPATFTAAVGWHTGTSGQADAQPDGQQTWTWASTVPYLDEPFQFAPHKTLARLPPDGIVISVQLFGPDKRASRTAMPPFRMSQAEGPESFEGLDPRYPLYGIGGGVSGQKYDVDISIFFGRPHPMRDQIAAADAELARLKLPDWTATD